MNNNKGLTLLLLILSSGFSAGPIQAASWPTFRRDEARTGYAQEEAAPPLTQAWTYAIPGLILSSPAAAYGNVYIGSRTGKLYCFDGATGALLWSFSTGDWIDSTPTLAQNTAFFTSRDGNLYAVDAKGGTLVWKYFTGSRDVSSPAVYGGRVYTATGNPQQKLIVLDAKSGAPQGSIPLSQFTASSPVLDRSRGTIYLGTSDGKYNAWNFNLLRQWGRPPQTQGAVYFATPALSNGVLVAAAGDDDWTVHAFNPSSGYEVWISTFLSSTVSQATSISISSDTVFVGAGYSPHSLYALDLASGTVRWRLALGNVTPYGVASSPAVANDVVYVMSPQAELYGLSAASGGVLAKISLGGQSVTSPAVSNGRVYAATLDGRVYGFQAQRAWAITSPDPVLDSVSGVVAVSGTVSSPQLQSYRLEYASGTAPNQWNLISQGSNPVTNGLLGMWTTTGLVGKYALRLTVQEAAPSGFFTQSMYSYNLLSFTRNTATPGADQVFTMPDGTEIDMPAGALASTDTVIMKAVYSGYAPVTTQNLVASNIVRQFKLASTEHPKFLKPVTIKIPYSGYTPKKEDNLRMYYFDDQNTGDWRIVNTLMINKNEKRLWATTNHFTQFQIMEYMPLGALLQQSQVYSYPNPARGNVVTFKFLAGNDSDVYIKVFDVSGELVAKLQKVGAPAGLVSSIDWDITGRASGVYIYTMEAKGPGGGSSAVTKKLAIIH